MVNRKNQVATTKDSQKATLDDLFGKAGDVDDARLAGVLMGKVSLTPDKDRVYIADIYRKRSIREKLIVVGLARHVLRRKGIIKEDKGLAQTTEWFAIQVSAPPKTVVEQLSRLKKDGTFDRNDIGYYIPIWSIDGAVRKISG